MSKANTHRAFQNGPKCCVCGSREGDNNDVGGPGVMGKVEPCPCCCKPVCPVCGPYGDYECCFADHEGCDPVPRGFIKTATGWERDGFNYFADGQKIRSTP